jgi:hypothetical protein
MEALLWILLPGFVAVASSVLAWFVMQSRMDVALANQRESVAATRGELEAERAAMKASYQSAIRAAEETARRQAFDSFLGEITVQQRHYTRENRRLAQPRSTLVLQERMFFRNLPLSDWIEHEIVLQDDMNVDRLLQDMTVFDTSVVNIDDARSGRRALA